MAKTLTLWTGLECTLNRIGENYFDQCRRTGHYDRLSDIELFHSLHAERIRYPCLWESVEDGGWANLDQRLGELRRLQMKPIAGLLHHGSGPRHTSLLDPGFPFKFADYARRFAERFPWIEDYTPINEPLTTARFSCLYGHWHPHTREDRHFVQALVAQIKATVLAMREIRKVNPQARLIQTEDLGRAQCTQALRAQCDFENERRWLTFDFLCGRVGRTHPLFRYLQANGLSEKQAEELQSAATAPDIVGINHYLLSDRFLDEQTDLYPPQYHGGNGHQTYADVAAVDTGRAIPPEPGDLIMEVWQRYQLPIALTEVHHAGVVNDRLLWLAEMWEAAQQARTLGADVQSMTAWNLLGCFDWNNLCTRDVGSYEAGIFELDPSGKPRETAVAEMVRQLASFGICHHPVLKESRRWRSPARCLFAAANLLEEVV
jgi:dTDP-4-dehydrorhamnose reductase